MKTVNILAVCRITPVACLSLAGLGRIWASESTATHLWVEKEIRTRHGLVRRNAVQILPELHVLSLDVCRMRCCYALLPRCLYQITRVCYVSSVFHRSRINLKLIHTRTEDSRCIFVLFCLQLSLMQFCPDFRVFLPFVSRILQLLFGTAS